MFVSLATFAVFLIPSSQLLNTAFGNLPTSQLTCVPPCLPPISSQLSLGFGLHLPLGCTRGAPGFGTLNCTCSARGTFFSGSKCDLTA